VHNFTLYNLANDDAVCYVWHEGEGELNANISASCIANYLETEVHCDKQIVNTVMGVAARIEMLSYPTC